ncbi:MAG TPA: hypothetical protein VGI81_23595 [Tepidisphaeraceae bacterium]
MVALPLFDVVMSSEHAGRSTDVARQLVEAALGELDRIGKLDQSLAPADPAQFDRKTAALIRGLYEQWAREAESLLDRVAQAERRFGPVARSRELHDAVGRTAAMLSISLDDMEAARRDVAEGRLFSREEARRELRLGIH